MADRRIGLKAYNYLSRYASVPLYSDDKGRTYHGTVKWLRDNAVNTYVCKQGDTLEKIAHQQYGSPILWWVVADINRIVDPFIPLGEGQKLKLVSLGNIEWGKNF